jgi:C-terminal processing protease CtpA/Prc
LAKALANAQGELSRTGKIVGLALDLRYASGEDYASVLEVAALFAKAEAGMLDWGEGLKTVRPASQTFSQPVAVLVNRQTTGSAEALAAVLREAGVALVLGQTTAGAAAVLEEFPLKTGQRLRIATSPVKLASGLALSPQGVKPDITVAVDGEDEKGFFADAYREPVKTAEPVVARSGGSTNEASNTNRVNRRPRPNEADLVRARREGLPLDGDLVTTRAPEPQRPVLRDPTLARAVDLLKGLAVVRFKRP